MTGGKWHLLSAPVVGQSISTLLTTNAIVLSGSNYSMTDYSESDDAWNALFTSATEGNMLSGKGYATKRDSDGIISMTGTLNTASKTVALTRDDFGWNFLGNPFSSAIAATVTADATNNLLTVNASSSLDPSYAVIYVWEEGADYDATSGTNFYKVINNSGGNTTSTQHYLQAGQGFFVRAKAGGEDFSMSTAMQSHQNSVPFKSDETAWANITLNAESTTSKASTRIAYNENMTRGLDVTYDAGLLNSYPAFSLYTRLIEDNGVDFMIQALPTDYEDLVVPIGLDAKAGEIIAFSAEAIDIPEEYAVVLEDRLLNLFTDLSDNESYSIQLSDDNNGTGRFFVHTSFKSALGFGDLDTQNGYQVFTNVRNNTLIIRGETSSNTKASIYNITGKLKAELSLEPGIESQIYFNEENGIYIIRINDEKSSYTQKFSWVR